MNTTTPSVNIEPDTLANESRTRLQSSPRAANHPRPTLAAMLTPILLRDNSRLFILRVRFNVMQVFCEEKISLL